MAKALKVRQLPNKCGNQFFNFFSFSFVENRSFPHTICPEYSLSLYFSQFLSSSPPTQVHSLSIAHQKKSRISRDSNTEDLVSIMCLLLQSLRGHMSLTQLFQRDLFFHCLLSPLTFEHSTSSSMGFLSSGGRDLKETSPSEMSVLRNLSPCVVSA